MEVIACVKFSSRSSPRLSESNEFPELHTRWVMEHTWHEEASWTSFLEEEFNFCPRYRPQASKLSLHREIVFMSNKNNCSSDGKDSRNESR